MLLLTDERMAEHEPGPWHPERPARLSAVRQALEQAPGSHVERPTAATRTQLERVHDADYVRHILNLEGHSGSLDPDTYVSEHSVEAAHLAAGAAIDAVSAVVDGPHRQAWALVRPPGHHAEAGLAAGFCLFNNIAVAAAHARAELGCERVLIVDWDVHHGNGTQHIFEQRADVLYFSVHQYPHFPGTGRLDERGRGPGEGYTVNVPLPAGSTDGDWLAAFDRLLVPIADRFEPDLVLVSAGFDGHQADPLAGMDLSEAGYAAMAAVVRELAERHTSGRLALVLEGGYQLDALQQCAKASLQVLQGAPPPELGGPSERVERVIAAVVELHRATWSLP